MPDPPWHSHTYRPGYEARLLHGGFRRVADSDIFEVGVLQRWQSAAPQPRGQVSAAIVGDLGAVEFDLSWLTSCRAVVAAAAAVAASVCSFRGLCEAMSHIKVSGIRFLPLSGQRAGFKPLLEEDPSRSQRC